MGRGRSERPPVMEGWVGLGGGKHEERLRDHTEMTKPQGLKGELRGGASWDMNGGARL